MTAKKQPEKDPRSAPDLPAEVPDALPEGMLQDLAALLMERYGGALEPSERVDVYGQTGPRAAWLRARVGTAERGHEFELFTRDAPEGGLDGALGLLVDFLDGVLEEFFAAERDAYLPLEFAPRRFEGVVLHARSALRDYAAEAAADALLAGRTVPGPEEAQ